MSEKLLELKNTTIKFGGITALNEVNFHVNKAKSVHSSALTAPVRQLSST
jgi:ABC-type branched-subunit amino acid transport system ATPase component